MCIVVSLVTKFTFELRCNSERIGTLVTVTNLVKISACRGYVDYHQNEGGPFFRQIILKGVLDYVKFIIICFLVE